jgi:putative transcriptional regulator
MRGADVRALRQRLGLTQENFAHAIFVTFSTVSRWENGHSLPSQLAVHAMERLAKDRGIVLESANGVISLTQARKSS